jgi:hypothetical protein
MEKRGLSKPTYKVNIIIIIIIIIIVSLSSSYKDGTWKQRLQCDAYSEG